MEHPCRDMIEPLEDRTLFSNLGQVPSDMAAIKAANNRIIAHLTAGIVTFNADLHTISNDLLRLSGNSANSGLLATLKAQGNNHLAILKHDIKALVNGVNSDVSKAFTALKRTLHNPNNSVAGNKFAPPLSISRTTPPPSKKTIKTDATTADTAEDTNLAAIGSANASDTTLATDIATVKTHSHTLSTTATTDLTTIATDVGQYLFDV